METAASSSSPAAAAHQVESKATSSSEHAWPAPQASAKLLGHRNDVLLLQFSHAGDALATGSKDGFVRVRPCMLPGSHR